MSILIFIFCVLYFILSYRRLDWAAMFLIAALPSYLIRFKIFGVPLTLLETMILVVFAVWFITDFNESRRGGTNLANLFKRNNEKIKISYPFQNEIILVLVVSFIAAGISGFTNEALGIWKAYFFEPILLFIVIINIFKAKDLNKIIYALAASSFIVSFAAIWQKIFFSADRAVSFFGYPNAVGLYSGPIILILIGWLIEKLQITNYKLQINSKLPASPELQRGEQITNLKFLIIGIVTVLSIFSIYFAKSEGALIGIVAGLIIFGLFAGQKARRVTLALVILAVIFTAAYQPARGYAIKKFTLNDFSGQVRKQQWQETWKMLKDRRILTGAGLANYQKTFAPYHAGGFYYNKDNDPDFMRKIVVWGKDYWKKVWQPVEIYLYPHNIFLNFWSELGFLGMLLFVWIIGKYFVIGIKLNRKSKIENRKLMVYKDNFFIIGLLGAMTVIMVHGLVDVPYFKNDLAAMFWVLIAMLGIIDLEIKKSKV